MDVSTLTSRESDAPTRPEAFGNLRKSDAHTRSGLSWGLRKSDETTLPGPSGGWRGNDGPTPSWPCGFRRGDAAPTRAALFGLWRGAACSLAVHALLACALLAGGLFQEAGTPGGMGGASGMRVAMVDLSGGDPQGGAFTGGGLVGADVSRSGRDGAEEKTASALKDHVPRPSARPAEPESSVQKVMEAAQPRTKKPRFRQFAATKRPPESEARSLAKEKALALVRDDTLPREQTREAGADASEAKSTDAASAQGEPDRGVARTAERADQGAPGQSAASPTGADHGTPDHGASQGQAERGEASLSVAGQGMSGQGAPGQGAPGQGASGQGASGNAGTSPGGADRAGTGQNGAAAGTGGGEPGLFSLAEVERKPRLIRQIDPDYPESARKRGLTGKVTLRIVVDERGHVHSPAITAADPAGVFDQCVLDAVVRWRFEPALRQGRCVAVVVTVPVRFDLASR